MAADGRIHAGGGIQIAVYSSRLLARKNCLLYYAPHAALRPYIAHYTFSAPESGAQGGALTLIPDASGCMVFTLRGHDLTCKIWGPTTRVVTVEDDAASPLRRVFVEFLPGGIFAFTGMNAAELTDLKIPLEAFDPSLRLRVADFFAQGRRPERFADGLDELFLSRLVKTETPPAVSSSLQHLYRSSGNLRVGELALLESYSPRHLSRLFRVHIGMNVKTFARILRVNAALASMKRGRVSLTALSQSSGFYDQAHFIHDFKAICRATPTQYLARPSDFYNEFLKF